MKIKPIRVLHVGADNIGFGGRSVAAYNLTQNINQNVIVNDFLAEKEIKNEFENNINSKKGNVIYTNKTKELKYDCKLLRKVNTFSKKVNAIKTLDYDCMHIHADTALEAVKAILIGKFSGIKGYCIHAHTTNINSNNWLNAFLILLSKRILKHCNYMKLACSQGASEFMYGKDSDDIEIITNGINFRDYLYNLNIREKKREELGIEGEYVIGMVARFSEEKNHKFLIDIFKKTLEYEENVKLILVGEGILEDKIKLKVKDYGIEDKVIFLGNRSDVNEILQALDIFILTSFFEGFGIVNVEAQASDLPCIVSTGVPKEIKINDNVEFIDLDSEPRVWTESILKYRNYQRKQKLDVFKNSDFNIEVSAKKMEKIYMEYFS